MIKSIDDEKVNNLLLYSKSQDLSGIVAFNKKPI